MPACGEFLYPQVIVPRPEMGILVIFEALMRRQSSTRVFAILPVIVEINAC